MNHKILWLIPGEKPARAFPKGAHVSYKCAAIDPASDRFNLPICEQDHFEPASSGEESLDAAADEHAEAELTRITPRNSELLELADRFPTPDDWYAE